MSTIFPNLKGGTITNNPLAIGGTSISSANFANLPAVSSPDFLWLTLDPDALVGAPEIVKVTAHTAAATTVTVARGQQSTVARAHNLSEVWAGVLTEQDLASLKDPDWVSWTPTINVTLGGGSTIAGRYRKVGKLVVFNLRYVRVSGTLTGGDAWIRITGWPFGFASPVGQHAFTTDALLNNNQHMGTVAIPVTSDEIVVVNQAEMWNPVFNTALLTPTNTHPSTTENPQTLAQLNISGTYETT